MINKTYIQIQFNHISDEQSAMLIALLSDIGFAGFEEFNSGLKTFIQKEDLNQAELDNILKIIPVNYTSTEITDQNWNAEWESSFEPIIVNEFVAVRAAFHQPIHTVAHEIIITPKMSFGTGHHATTYLVMQQMEKIELAGKTIMDFGTGTGILAILAEKMGAASILAIDNDEWSIENAKENIVANACSKITIENAGSIPLEKKFDFIIANINLNVILASLTAIRDAAKDGADILLSGFFHSDAPAILNAIDSSQFTHINTVQKDNWICMHFKRSK